MSDCLADDLIAQLAAGQVDDETRTRAVAHIETCGACRRLVSSVAREDDLDGPLVAGDRVGRYVVEKTIGAGAMGVVYSARDPELARSVALKLVRTDEESARAAGVMRERLLREARSLAQLAHPNVVTLYDVGTFGERVFLAMELVAGGTLTTWLRARERTQREIVDVFVQAGAGLTAAHVAGIVHRDFKPDNVLVGEDGRVRVTDFGLARGTGASDDGEPERASTDGSGTLTQTGAALGTPAYMAPEQRAGRPATVRTDVYAFAVAFYEALHGARPGLESKRRSVGGWLDRVIARGLSADPGARWASLGEMLAAIERGRAARRRGLAVGAVAIVALAAGAVLAFRPAPAAPCAAVAAAFSDVWGPEARASVRAAFLSAAPAQGHERFDAIAAALDGYGAAFLAGERDACEATRVRGDQSEAMLDAREQCLDVRRRGAAALVRLFAEADAELVANALPAVQRLPDVAFCANRAALGARALTRAIPRTPETDRFEADYADVAALVAADRLDESRARVEALDVRAGSIGDPWRVARVAKLRGVLAARSSKHDLANDAFHAAAAGALEAGDDELLADAWTSVTSSEMRMGSRAAVDRAAAQAHAAIARLGGDDLRTARLLRNVSVARFQFEGDSAGAEALDLEALKLYTRAGHADDNGVPDLEDMLAAIADERGDYQASLLHDQKSLDLRVHLNGPDHWIVDMTRANRANAWVALGRIDDGIAEMDAVLARHPKWFYLNSDIAHALREKGDFSGALARDTEARARIEESHNDPLNLRLALVGEGEDLVGLGREREAVEPLERCLSLEGPITPVDVARAELLLARSLTATRGDPARATKLLAAVCDRLSKTDKDDAKADEVLRDARAWQATLPEASPLRAIRAAR